MSKIHWIGGEKGGVGKSVVARLLAQYMIDRGIPFSAFDLDRSHGALMRFYQNYAKEADVSQFESLDDIYESALENSGKRVLVDLAAQTSHYLNQWMGDLSIGELTEETGLRLTYWHVMDSGRDSVDLLEKLLDTYQQELDYVIVLNQVRSLHFSIFEESPVRQRAMDMGAKIITIKRLHPPLMTKIDSRSASFWAAMNWNEGEQRFSLLDRQRVKVWIKNVYDAFDSVGI